MNIKTIICIIITILAFLSLPFYSSAVSAKSAIVIEASTGTVLYAKNADDILPEASTTKIMTALIALEACRGHEVFTVSANAASVDGSGIGLLEGEQIPLSDLLYMLMLKSGNDAAVTVAEGVAGSVKKFVDLMNARAREIGCVKTNFVNPHGLPHENHFTTARELSLIAAEAYKNAEFRKIVASKTAKLGYHGLVIENSNKLLEMYDYTNGMKTGFTKKAGRCLVSSAEKNGVSLICVTLNAPNDWNDHIELLDDAFSRTERVVLFDTGEYKALVPVLGGNNFAEVINTEPVYGIKTDGKAIGYSFAENLPVCVFAPVGAGKSLGYIITVYNNKEVAKTPLAVSKTVSQGEHEHTFYELWLMNFKRLFNPF